MAIPSSARPRFIQVPQITSLDQCDFCLENGLTITLKCGHTFDVKCLEIFKNLYEACPYIATSCGENEGDLRNPFYAEKHDLRANTICRIKIKVFDGSSLISETIQEEFIFSTLEKVKQQAISRLKNNSEKTPVINLMCFEGQTILEDNQGKMLAELKAIAGEESLFYIWLSTFCRV